jgi:hypothetical protein
MYDYTADRCYCAWFVVLQHYQHVCGLEYQTKRAVGS